VRGMASQALQAAASGGMVAALVAAEAAGSGGLSADEVVASLLAELGEGASLEDLICRIGERQKERVHQSVEAEIQRLHVVLEAQLQARAVRGGS
ncbi:unnamed protein product, partial [Polarella glacialis]